MAVTGQPHFILCRSETVANHVKAWDSISSLYRSLVGLIKHPNLVVVANALEAVSILLVGNELEEKVRVCLGE